MTTRGMHYHNSLKTSGSGQVYQPSTEICTQPLATKYTVGEQIGRGKFAVVKKCINNETKEEVAAKLIKKRRRGKSCRDEILREVVMLEMALDHPRLVNLKEVYETQSELILITEYCAGGELFTECVLEEKFNEADVRLLMQQILEGLVYLHEKFIVHLDLKPQNILLTKPFPDGTVKICDLGFACLVNTGEDIRDIIGTPDYVAPEVLNYDTLGLYTDMWSMGVLAYVMLTTCSPFAGEDKQQTFCNITMVNLDFPEDLFGNISPEAHDFITKLLIADPSERLTAKECQQHVWLNGTTGPSCGVSQESGTREANSVVQTVSSTIDSEQDTGDKDLALAPSSLANSIEPGTNTVEQLPVPCTIVNSINQGTSDVFSSSAPSSSAASIEIGTSSTVEQLELQNRNINFCQQRHDSLTHIRLDESGEVENQIRVSQHVAVNSNLSSYANSSLDASVSEAQVGLVSGARGNSSIGSGEGGAKYERPAHLSEMSISEGTDVDVGLEEQLDLGTPVDLVNNSTPVFEYLHSESGTNVDQPQSDSDTNFDLTSSKDSELVDSGMWSKSLSENELTDNATNNSNHYDMEISKEDVISEHGRRKESFTDEDVVMRKHDEKSDTIEIMDVENLNKGAEESMSSIEILNRSNLNNRSRTEIPGPANIQTQGQLKTENPDAEMSTNSSTTGERSPTQVGLCSLHELLERDNQSRNSLGTIDENVNINNVYPADSRHKRGMCSDASADVATNSESTEEEAYDFISVTKRVRSYEETYSPKKSPQFSPKSPRSPRVGRHSQRSSLHHSSSK